MHEPVCVQSLHHVTILNSPIQSILQASTNHGMNNMYEYEISYEHLFLLRFDKLMD